MNAREFHRILESIDFRKKPEIALIVDGLPVIMKPTSFVEPTSAIPESETDPDAIRERGSDLFEIHGNMQLHDKPYMIGTLYVEPAHVTAFLVEHHGPRNV
jgi:hypothetical protein